MIKKLNRIFTVIDPTTVNQLALKKSAEICEHTSASIHAYLCIFSSHPTDNPEGLKLAELERHELWLDKIVQPFKDKGIEITSQVEWDPHWREAFHKAAEENGCDMIVKPTVRHSLPRRRFLRTSDWLLLRNAKCPVLLVKKEEENPSGKVLIAVNIAAEDEKHKTLNDQIIEHGHAIANAGNFELHAVNAYSGSIHFVHPPDLAKRVGIDRLNAHTSDGSPADVILEYAREINAELVVIGSVARHGVSELVFGNTSEDILDNLECQIMSINLNVE